MPGNPHKIRLFRAFVFFCKCVQKCIFSAIYCYTCVTLPLGECFFYLFPLFCFGIQSGLFCILGLLMKSVLVDYVTDSFRMKKCFQIITTNPEPIVDFITVNLHRGATLEDVYGAFHHERKTMIITVLTRAQALALRRFIHMNDPHAFMVITASTEIVGKGFLAS